MFLSSRTRLALACGLSLVVLAVVHGAANAQKPNPNPDFEKKTVTFSTVDAVELKGTLWTNTNAKVKKNACVLLLHNFTRKGGNRSEEGWVNLGDELAKEGYTVLSFDFRGFGDSTTVGKEFWNKLKFPHNSTLLKPPIPNEAPTKIDYKDFRVDLNYYPHLVDDIAAAKTYLDTKVSDGSGNVVVVGAGESAALGAMWMAQEYRRHRDRTENIMPGQIAQPNPEPEPEGKDLACGIWLGLGITLDNHVIQTQVNGWLNEVGGKRNKVPMLFLYGKDEPAEKSKKVAQYALTTMMPGYKMMAAAKGTNPFRDINRDQKYLYTRDYAIDTKLEGSAMLQPSLSTTAVIKAYVRDVLEDRGNKESKRHDSEKFRYFWIPPSGVIGQPTIAKQAGEQFMLPIPPRMMGLP